MVDSHQAFKWLHILAAIVAVGANIIYGIWLTHAARHREALPVTLRGIKRLDDRLANPAYGLLLVIGLLMVFVAQLPLTTPWLLTSLVLYVFVMRGGLLGYTPTLRRQIQLLDSEGFQPPHYQALAGRGTRLEVVLAVLVIVIVFLIVVKPG